MAPWNDAVRIEYFLCYQEPVLDGWNITTRTGRWFHDNNVKTYYDVKLSVFQS